MTTNIPANLSTLVEITEIFRYFPPVNHSIFRTAAGGKISPLAPPIMQASINNTEYTLHFTGSTYSMTTGTGFRPYNLVHIQSI